MGTSLRASWSLSYRTGWPWSLRGATPQGDSASCWVNSCLSPHRYHIDPNTIITLLPYFWQLLLCLLNGLHCLLSDKTLAQSNQLNLVHFLYCVITEKSKCLYCKTLTSCRYYIVLSQILHCLCLLWHVTSPSVRSLLLHWLEHLHYIVTSQVYFFCLHLFLCLNLGIILFNHSYDIVLHCYIKKIISCFIQFISWKLLSIVWLVWCIIKFTAIYTFFQMRESKIEFYQKRSEMFESLVYLEEVADVLCIAQAELPSLLPITEVAETLLHVPNGGWMLCRLVANSPDCYKEGIVYPHYLIFK